MKTKLFLSLSILTAVFTVAQEVPVTPTPAQLSRFAQFTSSGNAKFGALAILGTASTLAVIGGLGEYVKAKDAKQAVQAETERLANRSYFQMFKDGASHYATSFKNGASHYATALKTNTWDKEVLGYEHGGKVATVAGVAAVAGLSYLAYKKFGKAVAPKAVVLPKQAAPAQAPVQNRRIKTAI